MNPESRHRLAGPRNSQTGLVAVSGRYRAFPERRIQERRRFEEILVKSGTYQGEYA
jgi:hypothetical protein